MASPLATTDSRVGVAVKQMKNRFKQVEKLKQQWADCERQALFLFDKAENLWSSLQAVNNPAYRGVAGVFSEASHRIAFGHRQQFEIVFSTLRSIKCDMALVVDGLQEVREGAFDDYEVQQSFIPLETACLPVGVSPTISDMLQWLHKLHRSYSNSAVSKCTAIDHALSASDGAEVSKARDVWKSVEPDAALQEEIAAIILARPPKYLADELLDP